MIKEISYHSLSEHIIETIHYMQHPLENLLFFDIETTGFHRERDHITSITFLVLEDVQKSPLDTTRLNLDLSSGHFAKITQIFCESITDELQLLIASKEILESYPIYVTYNGHAFDIPYLKTKYQYYNILILLNKCMSIDLYSISKKILKLSSYTLKNVEIALGIHRTDTISGSECVQLYDTFLKTGDFTLARLILNHNIEDVLNMLELTQLFKHSTDYFATTLNVFPLMPSNPYHANQDSLSEPMSEPISVPLLDPMSRLNTVINRIYVHSIHYKNDFCSIALLSSCELSSHIITVEGLSCHKLSEDLYTVRFPIKVITNESSQVIYLDPMIQNLLKINTFSYSILQYNKEWIYSNIQMILTCILKDFLLGSYKLNLL